MSNSSEDSRVSAHALHFSLSPSPYFLFLTGNMGAALLFFGGDSERSAEERVVIRDDIFSHLRDMHRPSTYTHECWSHVES